MDGKDREQNVNTSQNEDDQEQEIMNNGNNYGASRALFYKQYSVVKNILEKLPIRDLLSASQVCTEWADIGRLIRRQRRNRSEVMLYHPYSNHHEEAFEYFNGHSVSDAARHFIDNAQEEGFPSYHELVTEQSWTQLFPQLRSCLQKRFFESYSEPQMLLVVATAAIDEYMFGEESSDVKLEMMLSDIPKRLPCLASFSFGIVVSDPNEHKSMEMENSELPLLSTLTIPKVPGLNVKTFLVTKEMCAMYKGLHEMTPEKCAKILNINPEDKVKGIVLFHTDPRRTSVLKDALFHYLRNNPHVAFGGGSHYKNLSSEIHDSNPIATGLIICGDQNVNVASVGFFDSKISKRNEAKLTELKECEISDGDSFALMFACNGRGAHMHGSPDVESNLFRKHFPRTNLMGTFTGGEYCHEVIPTRSTPPMPPKKYSNLEYAFTTVFVFVSYKYPPKPATRV